MNWFVWRLLSSERLHLSPRDLRDMSLSDAVEAHEVLDAFADAEARASANASRKQGEW